MSRPLTRSRRSLDGRSNPLSPHPFPQNLAFFETFVGPKDYWLPPDNVQEHPVATVAHRTSPTNMGLSLLANLAAYDFGYLPAGRLIERTTCALRTMAAWNGIAATFITGTTPSR